MAGKIKVPSELVPSQSNKIMLRSKYIYDDIKGHTQEEVNAALEEQIESKVIAAGGVNWDTVPTAGSNNAVKSKDIKAALEKVTGYFVLDSNVLESTVIKTVTVADFPALAIGGSIKIKMLTKNTATNPTLKIGPASATAYPLYYNDERASASNSWQANEIISVFFDGTNYRASNSQGGSNKNIDAYLYSDLKTLALGETYNLGESVKTINKEFLYIIKNVKEMNLTDELSVNTFKVVKSGDNIGTYQSLKAISKYSSADTYSENSYAIGSPSGAIIQVSVDSETIAELEETATISVTICGIELLVDVDSTMDAVSIATAIYSTFGTREEWSLTNNSDGTLTLVSKVAKTSAPTISSDTGSTGITITFSSDSVYTGSNVLSKYSEGSWNTVTLDEFAADSSETIDATKVWLKLSLNALKAKLTKQDSVAYETSNTPKNITGGNSDFSICDEEGNVLVNFKKGEIETKKFNSKYTSVVKDSNSLPSLKICDDKGNVLVIFDNGHIKTKKFDSVDVVNNTTLKGKTFSALGDSISTFSGYIGTSNPFYPNNDVNSDSKTWWGRLKVISGLVDYRINAIGACTISRHLTSQVPISDSSRFTQLLSEGGSGDAPNFIIVFGGINDWNSGAALGNYTDDFSSPTTTFIPSVRYLMKQLQLTYPTSIIFFCTPVRSWYGSLSTYYPPTKGGRSLEDYVNAIIKCGSLHGVPIIDLYNNLNINEGNMTNMLIDKLHPKYAGNIAIATYIRHELEKYV